MRAYVVVALLMVWINNSLGKDICTVDCSYPVTADPFNCKNYYICYNENDHTQYPFPCEGDRFFDTVTHTCLVSNYLCTPECEKCSFNCSAPVLGKIANPFQCDVYYECESKKWFTCPAEKPFFDGNTCQEEELQCCTCRSVCTDDDAASYRRVPDFRNCTNFYECVDPGMAQHHGHCPEGNFDLETRDCNEKAPCIQPCANITFWQA